MTLTHDIEVGQHEATIAQWIGLGFEFTPPPNGLECAEPTCPVGGLEWFEMVKFANALSAAHDPPLEPCYVVEGCARTDVGYSFACEVFELTKDTAYECEGYRLPTRAEWQYAARAGTTTTYYSGNITLSDTLEQQGCFEEPNLESIAWYAFNSGSKTHPVGQKLANAWGLYDVLGNVSEWLHERHTGRSPIYPAQDPFGELGNEREGRTIVGGKVNSWPSIVRTAKGLEAPPYLPATAEGFRLARTLGPGQVPTLDDIPDASATE